MQFEPQLMAAAALAGSKFIQRIVPHYWGHSPVRLIVALRQTGL
jgi:hypothetical protein